MRKMIFLFLAVLITLSSCTHTNENTVTSFDGVKISYDVKGKNQPTLVFIHGWGGSKNDLFNQVDYFSPNYQTVCIDLAGFGESGNNRKEWTMSNFAKDVIAVMDHLKIENAILIGFSMGGIVILEVAKKIPDRVIGVIPLDVILNINLEATSTKKQIESQVEFYMDLANNPTYEKAKSLFSENADSLIILKVVDELIKNASRIGWEESVIDVLQNLILPNALSDLLKEITVPIHCINKAQTDLNLEMARRINPNISASSVENVGHFFIWEAPDESNRLLEEAILKLARYEY